MRFFLTTLTVFLATLVYSQTFQTGTITLTFNDPSRTGGFGSGGGPGRQIQTEIYYPATSAGSNVAVATGSFPVVVIGHGFVMAWDSYSNIYSELSKRGYIVALPRTEGGASPNHLNFGLDIALAGNKIMQLNATNTLAPIFTGKVAQKLALSGHSMGGGSSFLGAKNNSSVTCLFNFAAAQTNPTSSDAAKFVNVPTLIIGGEDDCVAPAATNQNKMWDSTASLNKFEVIIKNLTHCDFGNGTNFNCTFGQNSSGCANTVNNATAFQLYMNFVNPFLDALLKNNCTEASRFMDSVSVSQVIFSKQVLGTIACIPTSINDPEIEMPFSIYPNPALSHITIESKNKTVELKFISIDGKIIRKYQEVNSGSKIDISDLESGVYILEMNSGEKRSYRKLFTKTD